MKVIVGRIIRGVVRRLVGEVLRAVQAAKEEDDDLLEDPVVGALFARIHAHPDVESYNLFQNEWGGYTAQFTLRGQDFETNGFEADEALARVVAHVWGDDT